jgi:SAM-dependent methyltransferase
MPPKQTALHLLRRLGLLEFAEAARFLWKARASQRMRDAFAESHPGVALPPDEVAYDAFGTLDWETYWNNGRETAAYLAAIITVIGAKGRVLEWGCGPARTVRHLSKLLPGWDVFGSDYNETTIRWCARHIPEVQFARNDLVPPLPFEPDYFDCVYSVSVFTHLSEAQHYAWAAELRRVVKPGGILICTTHGDATRAWLRAHERGRYDAGDLVIRGSVTEGRRLFLAYHPERFVRDELLTGFDVLRHCPAWQGPIGVQDLWLARKR